MNPNQFFPRSPRNRIALCLAMLSVLFFIAWNFMPNYEWVAEHATNERVGFVFQYLWPEVLGDIKNAVQNRMVFDSLLGALLGLLLILQSLVMLSIIPAWKFWQSTFILRLIPAVLIIASGMILCYFLATNSGAPLHQRITLYLILANILTTAFSLLCFKNEWNEQCFESNSSM